MPQKNVSDSIYRSLLLLFPILTSYFDTFVLTASGPLRCGVNNGGCWKKTQDGRTYSACIVSGFLFPSGTSRYVVSGVDTNYGYLWFFLKCPLTLECCLMNSRMIIRKVASVHLDSGVMEWILVKVLYHFFLILVINVVKRDRGYWFLLGVLCLPSRQNWYSKFSWCGFWYGIPNRPLKKKAKEVGYGYREDKFVRLHFFFNPIRHNLRNGEKLGSRRPKMHFEKSKQQLL